MQMRTASACKLPVKQLLLLCGTTKSSKRMLGWRGQGTVLELLGILSLELQEPAWQHSRAHIDLRGGLTHNHWKHALCIAAYTNCAELHCRRMCISMPGHTKATLFTNSVLCEMYT